MAPADLAKKLNMPAYYHIPIRSRQNLFAQSFEDIIALGSGYFGDVYKAKLKRDNKYYAVK